MDDWSPDTVQRPDYPPPERPDTLLDRAATLREKWERWRPPERTQDDLDPPLNDTLVWPGGLTDTARAELLRCAEAFEATAARLRRIVDQ